MATLTPGALMKLLDGMISGVKPTSGHRCSLLQVIHIVPADLDEKDLWPKHGFYIQLSDSSHSVYVSLPAEQDDLVLSNKMQLGQFIYVEKLEPGSPVPIAKGVKPLPGRHPLVEMPEPLMGLRIKGEKGEQKGIPNLNLKLHAPRRGSWGTRQKEEHGACASPMALKPCPLEFDHCTPVKKRSSLNSNPNLKFCAPRRGSWGTGQKGEHGSCTPPIALKPCPLEFDHCTVKERSCMKVKLPISPVIRGRSAEKRSSNGGVKASAGGALLSKLTESPPAAKKSCVTSSMVKVPKSKSSTCDRKEANILISPFKSAEKGSATPSSILRSTHVVSSPVAGAEVEAYSNSKLGSQQESPYVHSCSNTSLSSDLPRKLSLLRKEVVQQRETAQKIALQALRNASATETLVRSLKSLSALSKLANAEDPADCFDQFLDFHNQIVQAISEMLSIKAATEIANKEDTDILHDIMNTNDPNSMNVPRRRAALHTSVAAFPETSDQKSTILGKHLRSRSVSHQSKVGSCTNGEKTNLGLCCGSLNDTIELGKRIETEAGHWFMEFLEKALEKGMKKSKAKVKSDPENVPGSLLLKVMNWVDDEQSDSNSSKRLVHPKAIEIARKLRIKMKNP